LVVGLGGGTWWWDLVVGLGNLKSELMETALKCWAHFKEWLHDLVGGTGQQVVLDQVGGQHLDEVEALGCDVRSERRQTQLKRSEQVGQHVGRQTGHFVGANLASERYQLEVLRTKRREAKQFGAHQRHQQVQSVQADLEVETSSGKLMIGLIAHRAMSFHSDKNAFVTNYKTKLTISKSNE
jgi:hypothetical protein